MQEVFRELPSLIFRPFGLYAVRNAGIRVGYLKCNGNVLTG